MKVCFFGLGSIGQRHLINLVQICINKGVKLSVHAFRTTYKPIDNDLDRLIEKVILSESELDNDYDLTFVTNPSHIHFNTIMLMRSKTKHMFIEKPLVDSNKYDFDNLGLNEAGVYYVAGPLRFSSVIQYLKDDILRNEKIYSARVICSSYLPDWRPGVDYRNVYSAKKDEGGGVCIDLIHEWDYITHLFGFPEEVKCFCGKFSDLEIDSEDLAVYIARYKDKLVELHLDYFGRTPSREIQLFTREYTIVGDIINNTIKFSNNKAPITFRNERNDMYLQEMEFVVNRIIKGDTFNNIEPCRRVLDLCRGRVD